MANLPVITERTGQQLVKALNDSKDTLADILRELKKQNGIVETPVYAIEAKVDSKEKNEDGSVKKITVTLDTAIADIMSAHEKGWPLALWLDDKVDGGKYSVPFYKATYEENDTNPNANMWQFKFISISKCNPMGRNAMFVITKVDALPNPSVNVDA